MKKIIFTLILVLLSYVPYSHALEAMTKKELKTTTGQAGVADFSVSENTIRTFVNTHIATWTEIDSVKLGYYDNGSGTPGWDQNWTNLSFGDSSNDFVIDGFIIKADFDNLSSTNPNLKRLIIGTNRVNGTFTGTFNSFSGAYDPSLTADTSDDGNDKTIYSRQNLGDKTFTFDSSVSNKGFFLILSPNAAHSGIQSVLGYTESSIDGKFALNEWWDSH